MYRFVSQVSKLIAHRLRVFPPIAATLLVALHSAPQSASAIDIAFTTVPTLSGKTLRGVYASGSSVYAATSANGVYISTDSASNWTNYTTTNGLGNNSTYSVFASGSNVYAGSLGTSNNLYCFSGGSFFTTLRSSSSHQYVQ